MFLFICRVNVGVDKISIFDSGPGMDDTDENSLVKWYVIVIFNEYLAVSK